MFSSIYRTRLAALALVFGAIVLLPASARADEKKYGALKIEVSGVLHFSEALRQYSLEVPFDDDHGRPEKGFLFILNTEDSTRMRGLVGKQVLLKGRVEATGPTALGRAYIVLVQVDALDASSAKTPLRLEVTGVVRHSALGDGAFMEFNLGDASEGTRLIVNLIEVCPKLTHKHRDTEVRATGRLRWIGPTRGPGGLILNLMVSNVERVEG